jgi:hypothetical protein
MNAQHLSTSWLTRPRACSTPNVRPQRSLTLRAARSAGLSRTPSSRSVRRYGRSRQWPCLKPWLIG